jgi:ornithine cyclodeaminase/alanine dehydrogenase-like protein (mu-crystallin family)
MGSLYVSEPPLGVLRSFVFKGAGGGSGDIAFANWIYAQARQKGSGQEWNFR